MYESYSDFWFKTVVEADAIPPWYDLTWDAWAAEQLAVDCE